MKIYFLVYNIYGMGGTIRTVVNTANYLVSKNYEVEIISVKRTSQKPIFKIDSRIKLTPLIDVRRNILYPENMPLFKKFLKKVLFRIPSILIDRNEDLYHMFNIFTDWKIMRVIRKIKTGLLITTIPSFNVLSVKYVDNNVVKIGQEHKNYKVHHESIKKKIKKYYGKLNALTCLTKEETDSYSHLLSDSSTRVYHVENATKIPFESANLENKVVIAAGRYVDDKGFDILIKAFIQVLKKHPDWKLKIFGSGKNEQKLRELIFEANAYNNIFLIPTTGEILKEMREASIYALSSRNESFGMVVIEAMSVGLPCVSFDCPGPKEIIKHNIDGILVESGNIEKFTEGINNLIEDIELRKRLGRAAKKNVERYSISSIGAKWEELITELSR